MKLTCCLDEESFPVREHLISSMASFLLYILSLSSILHRVLFVTTFSQSVHKKWRLTSSVSFCFRQIACYAIISVEIVHIILEIESQHRVSGAFLTPGSGMGARSGSGIRIRDEHPGSYFRELRNNFSG
jgi:hypothetical protein